MRVEGAYYAKYFDKMRVEGSMVNILFFMILK
jgi:hypothetical protein